MFPEDWLDRAHDSVLTTDLDVIADLAAARSSDGRLPRSRRRADRELLGENAERGSS